MKSLADILATRLPTVAILDIGAALEGSERYAALVDQGLASVTGYEPIGESLRLLLDRGRGSYFAHCLGDGSLRTFYVTNFRGCCSLLEPDPAVVDLFTGMGAGDNKGNFHLIHTVPVQTFRLDDVAQEVAPQLIKLDTQGSELEILQHGRDTLSRALVVEVEVGFVPLYKCQPLMGEVQSFLSSQGFAFHKLIDCQSRCYRPFALNGDQSRGISQLIAADAVFVRAPWNLAAYSSEQLLQAAMILSDVYLSVDLAHLLLTEYDNRMGGQMAAVYCLYLSSEARVDRQFLNDRTEI